MTTLLEDLQKYQRSRKFPDWQPLPTDTQNFTISSASQVIRRALDFLPLELQVAEWDELAQRCGDGLDKEGIRAILERNAADENKHDKALHYLSNHYVKASDVENEAANELLQRWQVLGDMVHPVTAMYALEMGVFFSILPALNKHGDVFASTVAAWISDDERVHVETNLRIMKHLKLQLTKTCLELVRDTVLYIFAPLGEEEAAKQAARSLKRLVSGIDRQMLQESVPVTIAYFEQGHKGSIVY